MLEKIKWANHEEWLAIRNRYIGGSDAGAVMGMNPYKGRFALWQEKTGRADPFGGSIATETGTYLEPFIAELFERETGKKVRRDNHTMVNSDYPWACANVDRRIVGEDALLECKFTSSIPNIRKFKNGEYPETWYCQMTHYLAVTGVQRIYLAVLVSGREFMTFTLERDESEIAALMQAEKEFWQHVLDDTAPDPIAQDAEAVKNAYPVEDITPDIDMDMTAESDLLDQYAEAVADYKAASDRKDEIQARICAALGHCEKGHTERWRVSWAATSSKRFDKKAFTAANPGIDLEPYHTVSTTRRFDLKPIKSR